MEQAIEKIIYRKLLLAIIIYYPQWDIDCILLRNNLTALFAKLPERMFRRLR